MKSSALLCWGFSAAIALKAVASLSGNLAAVDRYLQNSLREFRVPGMAVVVVEGDAVVYSRGYGIADPSGRVVTPQTPFLLGSTTKSFVAVAVLQLVETGKLELDAPITNYLPWFSMKDAAAGREASEQITLRHLLTHTSGIPNPTGEEALAVDDRASDALERQVRSFAQVGLRQPPGTGMEYANANYQIAGLVVQTVSGMAVEDYISQQIFRPLEMKHSHTSIEAARSDGLAIGHRYWFRRPVPFQNQPYPRGCFPSGFASSSAEDLGRWLVVHLNEGRYQGKAVLSPDGMALLHRPNRSDYAMGWESRAGALEHGGHLSCYGSYLYMDTAARRGVAVVFNANHADRIGGVYDIAPNVANLMAGRPLRPPSGDRHYRDKMVQIGLLLAGLGAWTFWSFLKVHRWSAGRKPLPSGLGYGFFLAAPLAIEAVAAGALVAAVPVKLSVAILHAPDLMMGLGFAGLLLLGWAAIRTAWVIALKVRATPPAPPVRVSGRQMVA